MESSIRNIDNFAKKRFAVFSLCWIAYASIYLCRANLSIAIPFIENAFGISKMQLGLLGSIFFWIYGIGQFVNGTLGDRFSARIFIFIGLAVTALANIIFGITSLFIVMIVCWAFNGWSQSMIWGPVAKTIALWYEPERRGQMAIAISTSMICGHLAAWFLSGWLASMGIWRLIFVVPGTAVLCFLPFWYGIFKDTPGKVGCKSILIKNNGGGDSKYAEKNIPIWKLFVKTKIWFVVAGCFSQGIIKDGISLWGPVYFMETQGVDIKSMTVMIILIPVMNLFGILLTGWLNKRFQEKEMKISISLFAAGTILIAGLLLFGGKNLIFALIVLGGASASMYGANTLLLGVFPMKYSDYGRVSTIAGFLDFCAYAAAGFTSFLSGFAIEKFGWNGLVIIWLVVAAAGMAAMYFHSVTQKAAVNSCAA